MKVLLIRDAETMNPAYNKKRHLRAQEKGLPYNVPHSLPAPAGTVIENPDCWQLVAHGMAVPHDDEARERCGMTKEEIAAAIAGMDNLQNGLGLDTEDDEEEDEEAPDATAPAA